MIEWLNKSYEEFPKVEGETERTLSITGYTDEIRLTMIVYINDIRHEYRQEISNLEYEGSRRYDASDVLFRRIFRKYREKFE